MKVALLSFHNAYNYGAALQAYGLQCAVQRLGVECEYLNYINDYRRHAYDLNYQLKSALKSKQLVSATKFFVGMPVMAKRAKKFEAFYSDYLKKTKRIFRNSEEAKEISTEYDKFIVGSDQVWNWSNNGGDAAFLLDFVSDDSKKISYSSSFGVCNIAPEVSELYKKYLGKFSRLATRESIGTEIIENLTGRKAHLVLDPVFLTRREEWDKIKSQSSNNKKKFIFCYTNRQSQVTDFLNTGFITDEDLHVLSTHFTFKDLINRRIKPRISMSPGEFINEIDSAELVVTASFHCLALAIIYHKQFIAILTGDHGKDERIINLLKITGLENRVLKSSTTRESILQPINYESVDARIKKQFDYSEEYLRRAVFGEQDIPFDESNKNLLFCRDSRCFGCGACKEVCPVGAIEMKQNEEGFFFPEIDELKCIHCHKCHSVCQVYSKKERVSNQRCYAVKNTDEIRKISSSGGMFRAMAAFVFQKKGVVCAAGMTDDFKVQHMVATNESELQPMCGTYYVQSVTGDCYSRIKQLLKTMPIVLFVGTPCQVKGLKDYLGYSPDNLVTCDLVCHGVPSPMVLDEFIKMVNEHGKTTEFKFRDKSLGWKGYHVSAVIKGIKVKNKLWLQSFNNLFSHNMINRLSCGSCPYSCLDRCSDITIGDFWGIEKYHKAFMDNLGISLVFVNTLIGAKLFENLSLVNVIEVNIEESLQNSLIKPANISSKRLQVFQTIRNCGYQKAMRVYGEVNAKGLLKNVFRKMFTS